MLDKKLVIDVMQKAARCWAGYEPVPGAKAYSEGSCRPKGSKKTKKEVIQGKNHSEKKAARPHTGQHSATPFDAPHAAGLLGMKPDANPQQVYNRMMHKYQSGGFNPAQFSELRAKYQGLPPSFTPPIGAVTPAAPKPVQAPVAKRPSPCGPGGCPVPGQVKPPVARTPSGTPRLVPGVPPVPAKPLAPGQRPKMTQMPPR
jgi:hypothetical protein